MNFKSIILGFLFLGLFSSTSFSQCSSSKKAKATNVSYIDSKSIVEIAVGSEDFTTLVAALGAADLVTTLQGDGPFTVFAPVNNAFAKLPEGTVESLLKPENKATLTKILTYHVVAGEFKANDVVGAIRANGGSFTIETVSGDTLIASMDKGNVILKDEKGGMSTVIATDVDASNGVIHVIDSVVIPE